MTTTSYEQTVRQAREDQTSLVLVDREGSRGRHPERSREAEPSQRRTDGPAARGARGARRGSWGTGDRSHRRRSRVQRRGRPEADARHRAPDGRRGRRGAAAVWRWIRNEFGGIAKLIARSDKAFVAAVNGAAAGVGLAFALTCDLILVSERASRSGVRSNRPRPGGRNELDPDPPARLPAHVRAVRRRPPPVRRRSRRRRARQRGRRPRPAAARGARVVRADRDAATPRAVDDEAAAPQRRRHDLGRRSRWRSSPSR